MQARIPDINRVQPSIDLKVWAPHYPLRVDDQCLSHFSCRSSPASHAEVTLLLMPKLPPCAMRPKFSPPSRFASAPPDPLHAPCGRLPNRRFHLRSAPLPVAMLARHCLGVGLLRLPARGRDEYWREVGREALSVAGRPEARGATPPPLSKRGHCHRG